MNDPEIFDRALRRRRRDRAAARFADHAFLRDHVADELIDRLAGVTRRFGRMLDLGCMDGAVGRRVAAEATTPMKVFAADAGFAFARMA
ncbi:MAG: SAM-dependent methyltransferase, partial [Sphingomonas bacterium]|nr:SAM-dependent methyltransferase [Sphingomonas bacterium]